MKQVVELLQHILKNGVDHAEDRTGHGRRRVFGAMLRFDISNGQLPAVTIRQINPEVAVKETLMFIGGYTNTSALNGAKIWDPWAISKETSDKYLQRLVDRGAATPEQAAIASMNFNPDMVGEIGPMYGYLWRNWPISSTEIHKETVVRKIEDLPSDFVAKVTESYNALTEEAKQGYDLETWLIHHYYSAVDQLNELVLNLKADPYGSRHLVTAFNPEFTPVTTLSPDENALIGKGSLMPCHFSFQVLVHPPKEEGGRPRLSLLMSIRSWDTFLGLPFNITGYALLAHLLAHCCNMDTDELVISAGDAHLYFTQIEAAEEMITREPLPSPTVKLNPEKTDLFAFTQADIEIIGYTSHPPVKLAAGVAV